jgi:hypothetical protein
MALLELYSTMSTTYGSMVQLHGVGWAYCQPQQLKGSVTGKLEPEGGAMLHTDREQRGAVYDLLCLCNLAQLVTIALKAGLNDQFLPSRDVAVTIFAADMLKLAGQPGACGHDMLKRLTLQVLGLAEDMDVEPLYRQGALFFGDMTVAQLGFHLFEWKTVHSKAQKLLLSIPELHIRRINEKSTDDDITMLASDWYRCCGDTVREILQSFSNFKFICSPSIENLLRFLKSSDYTARCIDNVNIGDREGVKTLKRSLDMFLDLLQEIMSMADVYIVEIAESLRAKNQ